MANDPITLLVNGRDYTGWTEASIEAGIDRAVRSFNIAVTEKNAPGLASWRIMPFDAVQLYIGGDKVLTGYVESYIPQIDAKSHGVRIAGHSKTKDLTDCDLDMPDGQFSGFTVAAIARAVCKLFGLQAISQTALADAVVQNTNPQNCEKAFVFLERLGRLAAVLLTDDADGNLVMTTAGSAKSYSALIQGRNVWRAHAAVNVAKRYSDYIVVSQAGIGGGATANWGGAGGIGGPGTALAGAVQAKMKAVAHDASVPRYRPRKTIGESQLTLAQMQQRANWQKQYAYGQATKATISTQGYRQGNGKLWTTNQIVPVDVPALGIQADLLLVKTHYRKGPDGDVCEMELGPVEGYTPDPGEVKIKKHKGAKGGAINWTGAGG